MPKKLTQEEFISRAKEVHGNKYDYSKVEYVNATTKVCIICPEHGEFLQAPKKHLIKHGCLKCSNNIPFSENDFIKKSNIKHSNKYTYNNCGYINMKSMVNITCDIHGIFIQRASHHLLGRGCPKCHVDKQRKSHDNYINEANKVHNYKYKYISMYIGAFYKIDIECSKHGKFSQIARNHLRGSGCPKCSSSKGEKEIRKYLINNNIKFEEQYKFDGCKNKRKLPFDFYLSALNICIEYDGEGHYRPFRYKGALDKYKSSKCNDKIKNNFCKENNIKLIRIPYFEFNNIPEILKAAL